MRAGAGFVSVLCDREQWILDSLAEGVGFDLVGGNLRIVDRDVSTLGEKIAADIDRGGFAGVVGILLKGETEDRDFLARYRVKELAHDAARETALLPIVHRDDLRPVGGDIGQAEALAKIGEIEDILLEARAAEADGRLEEFRADAAVLADGVGDLVDIGTGRLAERRDGVDGGNALGEERVGDELGNFGRPEVGRDDALARHPTSVDGDERRDRRVALGRALAADEHAIRVEQIGHRRALGEEFRIGKHLKFVSVRIGGNDGLDGVGGLHRNRGLFDDDLVAIGVLGDRAGNRFDKTQIGGAADSDAVGLRWRVDRHENDVGGLDGPGDIGGEKEIATARLRHDGIEARLVDGQIAVVPRGDALGVHVDDVYANVGTLQSDHGHRWPTHITSANAADIHKEVLSVGANRVGNNQKYPGGTRRRQAYDGPGFPALARESKAD